MSHFLLRLTSYSLVHTFNEEDIQVQDDRYVFGQVTAGNPNQQRRGEGGVN
jgi:hypothetical protein